MQKRISLLLLFFFIIAGCTNPSIKLHDPVSATIKEHSRFSVSLLEVEKELKETGVHLDKGSLFTILMDKELERNW